MHLFLNPVLSERNCNDGPGDKNHFFSELM